MKFNQCIIMRGVSGSGKSTLAYALAAQLGATVVSADHHFTDADGNYRFDPTGLGRAHSACYAAFRRCLDAGRHVIVDNTNAKARDAQQYVDEALDQGYAVTIIEMTTDVTTAAQRNVHGVDAASVIRQASRMMVPIGGDEHVTWRVDGTDNVDANVDMIIAHLL